MASVLRILIRVPCRSTPQKLLGKANYESGPNLRSRTALAITDTELNDMAATAIIGLNSMPVKGYGTPAATGTPAP